MQATRHTVDSVHTDTQSLNQTCFSEILIQCRMFNATLPAKVSEHVGDVRAFKQGWRAIAELFDNVYWLLDPETDYVSGECLMREDCGCVAALMSVQMQGIVKCLS